MVTLEKIRDKEYWRQKNTNTFSGIGIKFAIKTYLRVNLEVDIYTGK